MELSIALLTKLGSLIVHADEYMGPGGHEIDKQAFQAQLKDPAVQDLLDQLHAASLLPVKRS